MKLKKIIPIAITALITLNCMTFVYAQEINTTSSNTTIATPRVGGVLQDGFLITYYGTIEHYFGDKLEVSVPQYIKGPTGQQTLVKGVASNAFSIEKSVPIRNVTFYEGIDSIESLAFYNQTELNCVVFPRSIKSIASDAFRGCIGLETVYCYRGTAADNTALYRSSKQITFIYLD